MSRRRRPINTVRMGPDWDRRRKSPGPSRPTWIRPSVVPEAVELPDSFMSSEGMSVELSDAMADALSSDSLDVHDGTVVHEPTGEHDVMLTALPPDDSIVGEFVDHPFLNGLGVAVDMTGEWGATPTQDTDFVQSLPLELDPPEAPRLPVAGSNAGDDRDIEIPPPPQRWNQEVPKPVRPGHSAVGRHEANDGLSPRALAPSPANPALATVQPVPAPGRSRAAADSHPVRRSITQPGPASRTVPSRLTPIPVLVELEPEPALASWHSVSDLDSLEFDPEADEIVLGAPIRPINQLEPAPLHVGGPPVAWLEGQAWEEEAPSTSATPWFRSAPRAITVLGGIGLALMTAGVVLLGVVVLVAASL